MQAAAAFGRMDADANAVVQLLFSTGKSFTVDGTREKKEGWGRIRLLA